MSGHVWASVNARGDFTFTIGGDTAEEFLGNLNAILGTDAASEVVGKMTMAMEGSITVEEIAIQTVSNFSQAPNVTSTPAPPTALAVKTETDKWGAVWTYGLDNAPSCPHGQRVMKQATSQAGKPYKAWVCITHSPSAYRQKIQKDPNCQMEFVR